MAITSPGSSSELRNYDVCLPQGYAVRVNKESVCDAQHGDLFAKSKANGTITSARAFLRKALETTGQQLNEWATGRMLYQPA
jgi:hypothetical protein